MAYIEVNTLHQFHKAVLVFKNAGYNCKIHPEMLYLVKIALMEGRTVYLSDTYAFSNQTVNKVLIGWD